MRTLVIDFSYHDKEWEGFSGYKCPVLSIPAYMASKLIWDNVNGERKPIYAKIDGVFFPVYGEGAKVGTYRVPSHYPDTKVRKIFSSLEISEYVGRIASSMIMSMYNYSLKLRNWLLEDNYHKEKLIRIIIGGACWGLNDPKGYFDLPNWEVILRMAGFSTNIGDEAHLSYKDAYINEN